MREDAFLPLWGLAAMKQDALEDLHHLDEGPLALFLAFQLGKVPDYGIYDPQDDLYDFDLGHGFQPDYVLTQPGQHLHQCGCEHGISGLDLAHEIQQLRLGEQVVSQLRIQLTQEVPEGPEQVQKHALILVGCDQAGIQLSQQVKFRPQKPLGHPGVLVL